MKAETALITINGNETLKVLLIPETEQELIFLRDALDRNPDTAISFSDAHT